MNDASHPYGAWRTDDFDFTLPPELIAQSAVEPRDHARLLHVAQGWFRDHRVYDLPNLLREGDVLVVNNTKVIPARLYGMRGAVRAELLLHKKQALREWLAFARPGKRLRVGDNIIFGDDFAAEVIAKNDDGQILVQFNVADDAVIPMLQQYGEPPLPPYIKRAEGAARQDQARYQTIYAAHEGAVAAPTAGLHFTPELFAALEASRITCHTVTLHVGAGTFQPVKVDRLSDHVMHAEWGQVTADVAAALTAAKREGRRIVAVGTTSLRLLESAADEQGVIHPFAADTGIFIAPGYRFRAVDALMTNFHLPKSTLFMLVCAFAGYDRMRQAYDYAIAGGYRFYSFGDTTLLERDQV